MFNLTSSAPKSWQTVSRQADRANAEQSYSTYHSEPIPTIQELGVVLRERREAMGASLAEVETATRIRQKYLAALESDDWHLLPGEIVGRGFLRNYATYLGLDQTELVERRRAVADPNMASTLAGTSAASPLPPERNVDYRPKDVALKDEPEGIQQREIRTGPIFIVLGLLSGLFLVWWIWSSFGPQIGTSVAASINSVQTRVAIVPEVVTTTVPNEAAPAQAGIEAPAAASTSAIIGEQPEPFTNPVPTAAGDQSNNAVLPVPTTAPALEPTATPTEAAAAPRLLIPTSTPGGVDAAVDPTNNQESASENTNQPNVAPSDPEQTTAPDIANSAAIAPTNTPLPPPTNTPLPEPPTATPELAPTEEPTPAAPVVVAPACPDPRAVLTAPGVNQTIAGAVAVTGVATHEAFQYYKLEYAFGANATDGFVYFDGAENAVEGGTLGIFNTPSLPNGAYTLQLTVVDLSANYPPPCRVTVTIAN